MVSGQTVDIEAGRDLRLSAAQAVSDLGTALAAGGNITIEGAANQLDSERFSKTTKSGLFGGGGLSVTLGKQSLSQSNKSSEQSYQGSVVGAVKGDVSIVAGGAYRQIGSDVQAPGGDVSIQAKSVAITEARELSSHSAETRFKQSGLTVAVTSPVLSALQTASSQLKAASQTSDLRMKSLAAANVALNARQAVDAVKAGQALEGGNAADKAGGVGLSVILGSSRSRSRQSSSDDDARGRSVRAGGNISIMATGAGQDSDLTVRGSEISAAGRLLLRADDQINLLAAQNSSQESSSSRSNSGSIGMAVNLGAGGVKDGLTIGASTGKGQAAGDAISHTNSHVSGSRVTLESGGDTNIKGGVVQGEQITAKVGGDLRIESLQDQNRYLENSRQLGGSVTFGPAPGGSLTVGKTKIASDYLSVGQQSALRAGDGGFDVQVQGHTTLVGGQITSTQAAIDGSRNRYESRAGTTTSDLHNSANYSAQSVSVGLSVGPSEKGKSFGAGLSSVGVGSDKGAARSTSTAGISGMAGDTAARTGEREAGLQPIFDKDKARQEVNAQVAITGEFGKQASNFLGTEARKNQKALQAQADAEADPDKKASLRAEAAKWHEGGAYRVTLHAVIGSLTGGATGAIGAGAASAAAPSLNELQAQLQSSLQQAGLSKDSSELIASLAGGATAATIGAAASGGSATGMAAGFNADLNNRQLHPIEANLIRMNAKGYAAKMGITEDQAITQLTQQSLRQIDSAWAQRSADNPDAAAFLTQMARDFGSADVGAGALFSASGTGAYSDHTINAAALPQTADIYSRINSTNAKGITRQVGGAYVAYNDAAHDPILATKSTQAIQELIDAGQALQSRITTVQESLALSAGNLGIAQTVFSSGKVKPGDRTALSDRTIGALGEAALGGLPTEGGAVTTPTRGMGGTTRATGPELTRTSSNRTSVGGISTTIDADITWGKGIGGQGMPWEDYVGQQMAVEARLPPNFKTFDFFDQSTRSAISAKTLDTTTASKISHPERIFTSLKRNIDAAANFEQYSSTGGPSRVRLTAERIASREVRVAVPTTTLPAQWEQIQKAIQYGESRGVIVTVTPVKGPK